MKTAILAGGGCKMVELMRTGVDATWRVLK